MTISIKTIKEPLVGSYCFQCGRALPIGNARDRRAHTLTLREGFSPLTFAASMCSGCFEDFAAMIAAYRDRVEDQPALFIEVPSGKISRP